MNLPLYHTRPLWPLGQSSRMKIFEKIKNLKYSPGINPSDYHNEIAMQDKLNASKCIRSYTKTYNAKKVRESRSFQGRKVIT